MKVHELESFDFSRLHYGDPERMEGGYMTSDIRVIEIPKALEDHNENGIVLEDSAPEPEFNDLRIQFKSKRGQHSNIVKYNDRLYLDIYLSSDDPLASFICDLDLHNIEVLHERSMDWFSTPKRQLEDRIPIDHFENVYTSPLTAKKHRSKDGRAVIFNRLRLNVNPKCIARDQSKAQVKLSEVTKDRDIIVLLSLDQLWSSTKAVGCGTIWDVQTVMVRMPAETKVPVETQKKKPATIMNRKPKITSEPLESKFSDDEGERSETDEQSDE